MNPFESRIMWRIIAPLIVAAVITGASSIYTVARLSVSVENLQHMKDDLATKSWVTERGNMTQYRIKHLETKVRQNTKQIKQNDDAIRRHHPEGR